MLHTAEVRVKATRALCQLAGSVKLVRKKPCSRGGNMSSTLLIKGAILSFCAYSEDKGANFRVGGGGAPKKTIWS